jgi:hypothetical protein
MVDFNNLITTDFKNIFNSAIDYLLSENGLSVKSKLLFSGGKETTCNNCVRDPISHFSSSVYNGTGPSPFPDGAMCPVCIGHGFLTSQSSEIIDIIAVFDSKYWVNVSSKQVKIPDGDVQTLSKIELLPKLRNANEIIFDTSIEKYGLFRYERAGDPTPIGLGDNRYITTMWKRK